MFKSKSKSKSKSIFIFIGATLAIQFCFATTVDVDFRGKKTFNYKEVCSGRGVKVSDGKAGNMGQYVCTPNFKIYGGESLISERGDLCDSEIEYDFISGRVINMYLKYPDNSSENLLNVLAAKYGVTSNKLEGMFVDEVDNFAYFWTDKMGGFVGLYKKNIMKKVKENYLIDRRCTILQIQTSVMVKDSISLFDKSEDEKRRRIKNEAGKL